MKYLFTLILIVVSITGCSSSSSQPDVPDEVINTIVETVSDNNPRLNYRRIGTLSEDWQISSAERATTLGNSIHTLGVEEAWCITIEPPIPYEIN